MTRKTLGLIVTFILATSAWAGPPPRPAPLTPAQYNRLLTVEQQAENAAVRGARASYTSQRQKEMDFTRASDDFWTVAYTGGMPITILIVVIAGL